jgi:molecular chaperone IbpA
MATFDFSPLYRSTVGFDHLSRLLETARRLDDGAQSYPPYNIEKTGEDAYRITIALAGFDEDDLDIETRENTLLVSGKQKDEGEGRTYLHRGIAGRSFQRTFQLADHVKVERASLVNGLLNIDLVREIPEAMKPRKIEIAVGEQSLASKARKKLTDVTKKAA